MDAENINDIRARETRDYYGEASVVFDGIPIAIPLKFKAYVDFLESRVSFLEEEVNKLQNAPFNPVSDRVAETSIIEFIKSRRKDGEEEIDIVDIYQATNLPFGQINAIMKKLKSRGIKEVE